MATSEPETVQSGNSSKENKINENDSARCSADASVNGFSDNGRCCKLQDDDSICSTSDENIPRTSTPNRRQRISHISNSSSGLGTSDNVSNVGSEDLEGLDVSHTNDESESSIYNVPILGYEVMEDHTRFTVFKIRVEHQPTGQNWFVFRRYTDFVRLHKKLKVLFKGILLPLPPKRWFGNNFDPIFIEERILGLQAYIRSILKHQEICHSKLVRDFFCFDDPPEPHDSIEEMRAVWEALEEKAYNLKCQIKDKDMEIECLHARISILKSQLSSLVHSLKLDSSGNQSDPTFSNSANHDTRSNQVSQVTDLNLTLANMIEASSPGDTSDENNDIEVGLDATILCSERYSSCSSPLDQQVSDAKAADILEEHWTVVQEYSCIENRDNLPIKMAIIGAKNEYISNKNTIKHAAGTKKQQNTEALRTYENGSIATTH